MRRAVRLLVTLLVPLCASAAALAEGANISPAARPYGDPDALWNVVHRLCVPNQKRFGDPAPCWRVELRRGDRNGFAVLKDPFHSTQFLLIPTTRISGIESPQLLAPGTPNYFASAWRARVYVDRVARRTLPRDDIALAVNSASARTQNQLHIHIDCIRPDIRAALRRQDGISGEWTPLDAPLAGHRYLAMRVDAAQLDGVNPFQLLADGVPGARQDMRHHTLVAIGALFPDGHPGFILLAGQADPGAGDKASGEELQDHTCRVANLS